MEKTTRNTIQRATQVARELLESEFREQLEGTFDILLNGSIADQPGSHLSEAQKVLRRKLVSAIDHRSASGQKPKEAVDAYLREAAFTTLNRFVALKMLEARELVQECISKGEESSGYKEYAALAPGLVALADHGYRAYIESIFDEIGREVRVLFDRRDPASLLWPRRQALQEFLDVLNAPELSSVWIEDETIGWVYQYFNGEDERKKMREESQAPRNSRELAVRNQFFTPRYVVQFLVDNTLGRTWFEMMRGETSLKGLDYLVRRQHEVFLDEGVATPEELEGVNFGETPENPFPVPYRAKKDPRDLKILDPACGSGHFLLYTFDLLLTIYEEAWQDETAVPSELSGTTLRSDFQELNGLRTMAPELILRHNLHGIDIDPRAAQIAALALWLRAQRAFQEAELSGAQRPPITKTNIVVAEPMPGEANLLEDFLKTLDAPLAKVVKKVFEHMRLAGEAGYLLRIAELIDECVREVFSGTGGLFEDSDESTWVRVDIDVRTALNVFASAATESGEFSRQLFASDAARGLGFIEVCSRRYDAVLMNPPFGLVPKSTKSLLQAEYSDHWTEVYACFIVRALELLVSDGGLLGALTSNLWCSTKRQLELRVELSSSSRLEWFIDLGGGVLDSATVETACFVASNCAASPADRVGVLDLTDSEPDERELAMRSQSWSYRRLTGFLDIPLKPFCFHMSSELVGLWGLRKTLSSDTATVVTGNSTFDNFRFLRLFWEVPHCGSGDDWVPYNKGGHFQLFYSPTLLLWRFKDHARENRAHQIARYGTDAQVCQSKGSWFREGICYPRATSIGFSPRVLPAGEVCNEKSIAVYSDADSLALLGILSSSLVQRLLHAFGRHRNIENRAVGGLPIDMMLVNSLAQKLRPHVDQALQATIMLESSLETAVDFFGLSPQSKLEESIETVADACEEIDKCVERELLGHCAPSSTRMKALQVREHYRKRFVDGVADDELLSISYAVGVVFGRWRVTQQLNPERIEGDKWWTEKQRSWGHVDVVEGNGLTILVDDPGSEVDVVGLLREAAQGHALLELWGEPGEIDLETKRKSIARDLFGFHVKMYSASGRNAPVYWQLSTSSTSYSAWVYYHRVTRDTFFRLLNDHVTPKLLHEERRLTALTQEAGPSPSSNQRKRISLQEAFVAELRAFGEEVGRVAPLWNPNLNDGVLLNFAPLWRLVPHHKPWQRDCKKAWDKLCKGDYDWAHIAMHLWPERVVPKCAEDRSLAIAHELEDVFWQEDVDGKWHSRKVESSTVEQLIAERTVPAVKSALDDLISAPVLTGGRRRRTRS